MIQVVMNSRLLICNYREMGYGLFSEILRHYELDNPKYNDAVKMGRRVKGIDEKLKFWEAESEDMLSFPRGDARWVIEFFRRNNLVYEFVDQRRTLDEIDFRFLKELRPYQLEAFEAIQKKDLGTLKAPTGAGKTIITLYSIARRRQPTLIIVATRQLAEQWTEQITECLGIPKDEIGLIGGGKKHRLGVVTVALAQSLYKVSKDVAPFFGYVIIDEAHHVPSRTFTDALSAFDCKYSLGVTATNWRRDGLTKLIYWYTGNLVHEIDRKHLTDNGFILKPEIIIRKTPESHSDFDQVSEYSKFVSDLLSNPERNSLIADDMAAAVKDGRVCIGLSDRKEHCQKLVDMLEDRGIHAKPLTGDLKKQERETIMDELRSGRLRCVLGTGSLCGEGLDVPVLDSAFIVSPVKFDGRLLQYLGRILRTAPGKRKPLVFDYLDEHHVVLNAQGKKRQAVYRKIAANG